MSTCESCNKTVIFRTNDQKIIDVDQNLQAKVLEILQERFNITGIHALNQQVLEKLLREYNMTREDFLASIDDTTTRLIPNPTTDDDDATSWGLIVPIILIAIFLVIVAGCLYWHSRRYKGRSPHRNVDRSVNTSFERFARASTGSSAPSRADYVRASTRSNTPGNSINRVNVVPLTSDNPGQFKFYWDKDNWKLCPPEDMDSHTGITGSRSSLLRQNLSPIDEVDTPCFYSDTRSYEMEAQPPFSPYHLTWITPKAPPPSYEESELSVSPEKSQRHFISTTGTNNTCSGCTGYSKSNLTDNSGFTKYNVTDNTYSRYSGYSKENFTDNTEGSKANSNYTCSGYTGYSKNMNSPFYPNNNTPNTDIEFMSEQESMPAQVKKRGISHPTSNANSQFTSYPSTPHSSLDDLSETNIDTVEEISYRKHTGSIENLNSNSNRNSQYSQYIIETDHNRNSRCISEKDYNRNSIDGSQSRDSQYTNGTTNTRNSQYDEEYSMGVPSLPSSILNFHQRMADNSLAMTGKPPKFSPYALRISQASSIESSDTNYTDNTSMLPCVGSSITSGNPTGVTINSNYQSNVQNSMEHPYVEISQNTSPEDLSKIVDELSSIRPGSNEPPSVNRGVVNSLIIFDGTVGHSYMADICPPQHGATDGNVNQNITELFRSWSVTAELDYSSASSRGNGSSMQTPLNEGSFSWDTYPLKKEIKKSQLVTSIKNEQVVTDVNHNVVNINDLPQPGRNVQFSVPVLVDKTYWV